MKTPNQKRIHRQKTIACAALVGAVVLAIVVLFLASEQAPNNARNNQPFQTRDGDSLETQSGRQIRLACIDAPEYDQPGGLAAHNTLESLVANGVTIQNLGADSYGRMLAVVFPIRGGSGDSVNTTMVRMGQAWVYRRFANDCGIPRRELCKAEAKARAARIGLWQESRPIPPWQWRQGWARSTNRFPPCEG